MRKCDSCKHFKGTRTYTLFDGEVMLCKWCVGFVHGTDRPKNLTLKTLSAIQINKLPKYLEQRKEDAERRTKAHREYELFLNGLDKPDDALERKCLVCGSIVGRYEPCCDESDLMKDELSGEL